MKTLIVLLAAVLFSVNTFAHQPPVKQDKEEYLDVALDIAFIGKSAFHLVTTGTGWGALALDVGCLFIPGATGLGSITRAGKAATSSTKVLTKGAVNAHRAQTGYQAVNVTRKTVEGLMARTMGSRIKASKEVVEAFFKKATNVHGFGKAVKGKGEFAQGLCCTSKQAQKLFNEAMQRAAGGNFVMKTAKCPYDGVMICIDMGKVIGKDGNAPCRFINLVLHGGKKLGTMYPVKSMAKAMDLAFDYKAMYGLL